MGLPMCSTSVRICIFVLLSSLFAGASHTLHGKKNDRMLVRRESDLVSGLGKLTQDASPGPSDIPIPILAVEPTEGHVFTMPGVPNKIARNLGLAARGKSRLEMYTGWTRAQTATDPDQLAIFVDGYNVVSGGCDDTELRENYRSLVRAGGNTSQIVVGATFGDQLFGGKENNMTNLFKATVASQREAVLTANALKADVYSDLVNCDGRPCISKPVYEFADLGFVMGPVGKLHELFVGIAQYKLPMESMMKLLNVELAPSHTHLSDDEAVIVYALTHKNAMVLDYTGSVELDLRRMKRHSFLKIKHGVLVNDVTKKTQCFIRGDGSSGSWASSLASELRG